MRRSSPFVVSLVILFLLPLVSSGWWDISHTAINKAAGVSGNSVGQLPDIWLNREWDTWGYRITKLFCWSHAVQDTGQSWWWGGLCPRTPTDVIPDREPGAYMQMLLRDKIKDPAPGHTGGLPMKTALSFRYHNAADSVVHYSYFTGGSPWAWGVGHYTKEQWADYMIYLNKANGAFNNYTKIYDDEGNFDHYEGGEPVTPITAVCSGDAKIIQLAQQAYIKNRLSTKQGGTGITDGLGSAQRMGVINTLIQDYERTTTRENNAMRKYTFEDLQRIAHILRWDKNGSAELWLRFDAAVRKVRAVN